MMFFNRSWRASPAPDGYRRSAAQRDRTRNAPPWQLRFRSRPDDQDSGIHRRLERSPPGLPVTKTPDEILKQAYLLLAHNSFTPRIHCRLSSIHQMQLAQNIADMSFDGL